MDFLAKLDITQSANYIVFDNSLSLVESLLAFNSIELFYRSEERRVGKEC